MAQEFKNRGLRGFLPFFQIRPHLRDIESRGSSLFAPPHSMYFHTPLITYILICIQASAINFIILIVADLSMVLRRIFRLIIILGVSCSASLVLLSQMIVQLHYFGEDKIISCKVSFQIFSQLCIT
jgi:hypothetical protein